MWILLLGHAWFSHLDYSSLSRRDTQEIFAQPVDPQEVGGWFLASTCSDDQNVLFLSNLYINDYGFHSFPRWRATTELLKSQWILAQ